MLARTVSLATGGTAVREGFLRCLKYNSMTLVQK